MPRNIYGDLQALLRFHKTSLSAVLVTVLSDPNISLDISKLASDLLECSDRIISAFYQHSTVRKWATRVEAQAYLREISILSQHDTGWHFSAYNASASQITDFRLEQMATEMSNKAPRLWNLLGMLISDSDNVWRKRGRAALDCESEQEDEEAQYWRETDALLDANLGAGGAEERRRATPKQIEQRRAAIQTVRKIVIVSIMLLSINQKCNILPSVIGIFCHSNNTPEKVLEVLQRLGLSISVTAINDAIGSLSMQAATTIRQLGQTLTAAYAYDNFDIEIKASVPTVQKSSEIPLKHLTSALMFPLPVGTTKEDMKCSHSLWERQRYNDILPDNRPELAPIPDWKKLFQIHSQYQLHDATGLSGRQRWIAWKFVDILLTHGPEKLRKMKNELKAPEVIDQVPLTKTNIVPARAMDCENSTVSRNLDAIANLMEQGGVGDAKNAKTAVVDCNEYVLLFHGDLGTGERIIHGQLRRTIEKMPALRYQSVIFVLGLFHLKMACADALWRILIQPENARQDDTSVFGHVRILRPRETGKVTSAAGPGFRRMHQIIEHDLVCRVLACWQIAVAKRHRAHSLDTFADTEPTIDEVMVIARHLAVHSVANQDLLSQLREHPPAMRDEQYANALLINQYYFLYEELTYAMNAGDIGRVEACVAPWALIFKATGKHKYAAELIRHITNVHFFYPAGLKRAIRYSMLINPSGKRGKYRAVDWQVELNNLYTKSKNVVHGVNYTVDNIIKESVLISLFQACYITLEKNLVLGSLTTHHTDPDMTETFAVLCQHLEKHAPYRPQQGRKSKYQIPNMLDKGLYLFKTHGELQPFDSDDAETTEMAVALEDVSMDLDL